VTAPLGPATPSTQIRVSMVGAGRGRELGTTRMGGRYATDELEPGHYTQGWLATSDEPAPTVTGLYWYHRSHTTPCTTSPFQDHFLHTLDNITGHPLPVDR
jgi:hypothetical protein